jgi:hypothetical protein
LRCRQYIKDAASDIHLRWSLFTNGLQEKFEDTKTVIRSHNIEEEQTTQWSNEKGQKDKQRSSKHHTEN